MTKEVVETAEAADPVQKVAKMIEGIRIAMLTTLESDGNLSSRPMATQSVAFDGTLWFFISASSWVASTTEQAPKLNVSYSDPDSQRYVSVCGRAEVSTDRAKIKELWNPMAAAWFTQGVDDPDLRLLKITVDRAEYWDAPQGKLVQLMGMAKAALVGERYRPAKGAHGNIDLSLH